jgi:hypothetical protein
MANKVTTTMHLYPDDYKIVKEVADELHITIPEAAELLIRQNHRKMKSLRPLIESCFKIVSLR